jgi:hypothetical protein
MLNTRLMSGQMPSAMRTTIINRVTALPASDPLRRARNGAYFIIASPQFNIER